MRRKSRVHGENRLLKAQILIVGLYGRRVIKLDVDSSRRWRCGVVWYGISLSLVRKGRKKARAELFGGLAGLALLFARVVRFAWSCRKLPKVNI